MTAFVIFVIALCSLGGVTEGIFTGNLQNIAFCSVVFLAAIAPLILRKKSSLA